MRKNLVLLFAVLSVIQSFGQVKKGYDISVTIAGLRDSSIYLAYHYGDKQYIRDTAIVDAGGNAAFKGTEALPQGIYMVVLPGRTYFEILVGEDQQFSASCKYIDYYNTLEFKGSEENSYFITYQKHWVALQKQGASLSKRIQANKQNNDSLQILGGQQKALEEEMVSYLNKVITDNGSNLLAMLVKAMLPVKQPEFKVPPGTHNPDSLLWVMKYNYNKDHFFDNMDLNDDRILRTPLLYSKLEAYFKNDPIQLPDSLERKIDFILKRCQGNHDVFQYISVYLFNHFRESEIMGHDAIIVKLADDIYLSGKADWVTQEFRDNLSKQVALLRNNLIGMKAKDLVMDSYRGVFVSLYDVDKDFTILYFWEPNCGHCMEATPKLKAYYDKPKDYSVEVFAVCTISDKTAWSKYIAENNLTWINGWDPDRTSHFDFYYNIQSTPMVYILNRNKKIIAKKLAVEDIEGFINNYRKYFR